MMGNHIGLCQSTSYKCSTVLVIPATGLSHECGKDKNYFSGIYSLYQQSVTCARTTKTIFLVNIRDTSKVCACAGTTRYHQDIYRLVHMHLKTTYLHIDTHMRYVTRTDMHALPLHIAQPAGCYQATARPSHGKRLYRA